MAIKFQDTILYGAVADAATGYPAERQCVIIAVISW